MAPELIILIVVVVAVAVVGLVGLSITIRDDPVNRAPVPKEAPETLEAPKPGAVDGALDIIDRSIGMYLLRRLTGRPTTAKPPKSDEPAVALSADEVAYRIGVAGTPAPHAPSVPSSPLVGGPPATPVPGLGGPSLDPARPTAPRAPGAPRERLVRDSGVALLVLAVIGLVAVLFWPHDPSGEPQGSDFVVDRDLVTPGPTGEVDAATAENSVEPETPVVSAEPTQPTTPYSTAAIAPRTAKPTPRVTLRPGQTPTPTPRATPKPTSTATPSPSSSPTSEPSQPPTPEPTPAPTPEPTPAPTPEPTPAPTPDPTASP